MLQIPFLHEALNLTNNKIKFFSSLWSAPKWLKTNGAYLGGSIKENMYQVYADYFVKFLDEYKKQNIEFWGITTGNEPNNDNSHHGIPAVEWTGETQVRSFFKIYRNEIYVLQNTTKLVLFASVKLRTFCKSMATDRLHIFRLLPKPDNAHFYNFQILWF